MTSSAVMPLISSTLYVTVIISMVVNRFINLLYIDNNRITPRQ